MLDIKVIYASTTRQLSLPPGSDLYGGATIDSNSVRISIYGIDSSAFTANLTAHLDFAINIMTAEHLYTRPSIPLEKGTDGQGETYWSAVVPTDILAATSEYKKLPFQLVLRDGDTQINSRNTIVLTTTRAIDAAGTSAEMYKPYVMFRNDSWLWEENFTYKRGAVVSYGNNIYASLVDDNVGHNPEGEDGALYWGSSTAVPGSTIINVAYDEPSATLTFTMLNGSTLSVAFPDLRYDLFRVATEADLPSITGAQNGDMAVTNAGVWYVYYNDGVNSVWNQMSSPTSLNGSQTTTPAFYAPLSGGVADSAQYLTSDGTGNAPVWESKITSLDADTDSSSLPTSSAVVTFINAVRTALAGDISDEATARSNADTAISNALTAHTTNKTNPHEVTKAQVGLGNADNTSDMNKPVSTAQAAAIKVVQDDVDAHEANISNPHSVTKAQVGLGSVVNATMDSAPAEDSTNYVSSGGVWTALEKKQNTMAARSGLQIVDDTIGGVATKVVEHTNAVTAETQGLGSASSVPIIKYDAQGHIVTGTTSASIQIAESQVTSLETDLGNLSDSITGLQNNKVDKITKVNNHALSGDITISKSDVGLGNVDNTADLDKPISTATQTALDGKVDANTAITGATKCKITYDSKGLVTGGADLVATDIPSLAISKITNLQTTLDGKAPTNHRSTTNTYGLGDDTYYGHVKMASSIPTSKPSGDPDPESGYTATVAGIRDFVNSSISTGTGAFLGTIDVVDDLGLTVSATNAQIQTALANYAPFASATNSDYCFVTLDTIPSTPAKDEYRRFKYTGSEWLYEYTLNNSSFTTEQWDAINSGITDQKVTKLDGIEAGAEVNVQADWTETNSSSDAYILHKPTTIATAGITDAHIINGVITLGSTDMTPLTGVTGGTVESGKYISALSVSGNNLSVTKASLPQLSGGGTALAGYYVSGVTVDSNDKHKIVVATTALPILSGGGSAGSGKYISSITVNGHAITIGDTTLPTLSKGSDVGSGTYVTDVAVNGHTITLTRGNVTIPGVTVDDQGSGALVTDVEVDANNDHKLVLSRAAVTNSAPTLAWGTTSTIGTIGSTALTVTMPANPDTDAKTTSGQDTAKLFIVGAKTQSTSGVTTYSNDKVYVDGNKVYSNNSEVVNLGDNQVITGKKTFGNVAFGANTDVTNPNTQIRFFNSSDLDSSNGMVMQLLGYDTKASGSSPANRLFVQFDGYRRGGSAQTEAHWYIKNKTDKYVDFNIVMKDDNTYQALLIGNTGTSQRAYNPANIYDIVTIGMLNDTSNVLVFKGAKYTEGNFYWRDPTNARNDTFTARTWMSPQLRMVDKNGAENARIQVMYDTTGKHELHLCAADSAGSEKTVAISSAGYATAPARAYTDGSNNQNYGDILTKWHLEQAITIGGHKTFTDFVSLKASDRNATTHTGSGNGYGVDIYDTNGFKISALYNEYTATASTLAFYSLNKDSSGNQIYTSSKIVKQADGKEYMTAPYRSYSGGYADMGSSEIITKGALQASTDVVHRSGDEIISGAKTFTGGILLQGNGIVRTTTANAGETPTANRYIPLIQAQGADNQLYGFIRLFCEKDTEKRLLQLEVHSHTAGGTTTVENAYLQLYAQNGTTPAYATAPNRTYNASNTGDIVTIGMLNTAMTIDGQKTFSALPAVTSVIIGTSQAYSSGTQWTSCLDFYANNNTNRVGRIVGRKDGAGPSVMTMQIMNSSTSAYVNGFTLTYDGTTAYSSTAARSYASAGNQEVLVKGHVADMMAANVGNGQISITSSRGVAVDSFTVNQSSGKSIVLPASSTQYQNQSVTFALQSPADFADYPYMASYSITGLTSDMYATVAFSDAQVSSGQYAPFCQTVAGAVRLYAKSGVGTQTIPTISVGMDDSSAQQSMSNFVTLTGAQTVGGTKTFSNNPVIFGSVGPELTLKHPDLQVDANPSATKYNLIFVRDKNNAEIGSFGIRKYSSGDTQWYSYIKKGSRNTIFALTLNDTENYMVAPARTYDSSHTTDIVTIGSLQASTDVVHRSGDETISGVKHFNNKSEHNGFNSSATTSEGVPYHEVYDRTTPTIREYAQAVTRNYSNGAEVSRQHLQTLYNGDDYARLSLDLLPNGTARLVLYKSIGGVASATTIATL